MHDKPGALVTGANQGIGLQIAKDLAAKSFTVLVGSRNIARGEEAAKTIEGGAAEAVRVALLGPDGPTGTFSHATLGRLPW